MKPSLFIGSAVESLKIAHAVHQNLQDDARCKVWTQGIFDLSKTTIENLMNALDDFDYALFVFTPDDLTKIRHGNYRTTRDNVIFELGLFTGSIGRERTFILLPRKVNDFHLPTDLLGVTPATYDSECTDEDLQSTLGPACNQIRNVISKLGPYQREPLAFLRRPGLSLSGELKGVTEAWFAWHTGSVKSAEGDLLEGLYKIRLILTNPKSSALHELEKICHFTVDAMSSDIEGFTKAMKKAGHLVAWFDGLIGSSIIIADPHGTESWARIENLIPYLPPVDRPSIKIFKKNHLQEFKKIVETYEKMWTEAEKQ